MTGIMPSELFLFAASVLLLCLFVWTAGGMFPDDAFRPPALRRPAGAVLLYGAILIFGALGVHLLLFAAQRLPWPAAVIVGGLVFLASPFIHKALPLALQDGAAGIVGLTIGGLILHGMMAVA